MAGGSLAGKQFSVIRQSPVISPHSSVRERTGAGTGRTEGVKSIPQHFTEMGALDGIDGLGYTTGVPKMLRGVHPAVFVKSAEAIKK
jgi:hypothetical protein